MEKKLEFKPKGVCCYSISITTDDDIIKDVAFSGGCSGNLQGLSQLVRGSRIDDVIERLNGIKCGFKNTSCPDQLAAALEKIKNS